MTGADPASSGRESGILAEPPVASAGRAMPLRMVAVAVLALFGVAAFGLAPDTVLEVPPTVPVVRELPLPESAMRATAPEPAILWREERVTHQGRFYQFDEVGFEPKPARAPVPGLPDVTIALAAAQQHSSGKQRGKARPQPWEIMT